VSRVAALIASAPDGTFNDLPPGTARAFAETMLRVQVLERDGERELTGYSSTLAGDEGNPRDPFRALDAMMADGFVGVKSNEIHSLLGNWVSLEPAAATSAVLKMPTSPGRTSAVDAVVSALAQTNAAAALEFALKSGEQSLGSCAAIAWAQMTTGNSLGERGDAASEKPSLLSRMSPAQQESLFTSLAGELDLRSRGSAPQDRDELFSEENLKQLAQAVLQSGTASQGVNAFFQQLCHFPGAADAVEKRLREGLLQSYGSSAALDILYAARLERSAASGEAARLLLSGGNDPDSASTGVNARAVLERAAPSMIAPLARAGRISEAVQVLDHIRDPDTWSKSFQSLLPAWMDADPKAAREAFNAAPLTALERERLQRHPAFLLHPDK
jgi:hypothetical protein